MSDRDNLVPTEPPAERAASADPERPMADYCAACGAKAPELPPQDDADRLVELRDRGWLCLPSRSLHRELWPRAVRNCMCPYCLCGPTPFARKLLRAWGLAEDALAPPPTRSPRRNERQ
jgi:hypothetical protein